MSRNGVCTVILVFIVAACGGPSPSSVAPGLASGAASAGAPPVASPAGPSGASSAVPSSPTTSVLPVLPPDQPLLLFNQVTGAGGGVFVSNAKGTDIQRLAADVPGVHKRGGWSPDGQKVVFIDETTGRMYVAHLDGSPTEHLSVCDRPGCDFPAWSPDGTRIAFSRVEGGAAVGPASVSINILDLAASTVTTAAKLDRPLLADVPRWSPDGRQVVFGIDRMDAEAYETGAAIAIVPVAGGQPRVLTDYDLFGYNPDWSWTRNEIVFATDISGAQKDFDATGKTWDLWLIHPDGGGLRRLTRASTEHRLGAPRWSPDGSQVTAYDFAIPGGVIVDATNGSIKPFVTTGNYTRPTIRPLP